MRILLLCLFAAVSALSAIKGAAQENGYVSLFDGKTLKGWDGNPDFWSVRDGAITGQTTPENPTRGNTFLVYRGGEFKNFDLKFVKIVGGIRPSRSFNRSREQKW